MSFTVRHAFLVKDSLDVVFLVEINPALCAVASNANTKEATTFTEVCHLVLLLKRFFQRVNSSATVSHDQDVVDIENDDRDSV